MSAESIRTLKEARALLYPWIAVMAMCIFPPLARGFYYTPQGDFSKLCLEAGILIGIPLLASLSFGNEFRHRTMEMLASQPIHRMQVWREKWTVTVVAVLTAGLAAYFSWGTPSPYDRPTGALFVAFFIVTTCSATFWTLLARSLWADSF
jgi:ABC-type transport system involved in multi-copper enzyme maturation permease subunit